MLINIERLAYQHRIINNHSNSSISTARNTIGIEHYVHIMLNKHRQIGWANIDSKIIIITISISTAINTIGIEHYVHIMLISIDRLAGPT
ncbi:hypothetical protein [Sphingobacterium rhinopitheci]|uniref:hypothetical protein n=1 Tax=Sphingobacterium rhinopitheci TaxID=2781960 RepID=UPI001F52B227|nr:hypothetical protein [Sphingobacterium rhinopitheci]MCI0920416.1 hypothetical protein [Sphingobacterium rhinopitheci]